MDHRRRKFLGALIVFAAWVSALGALALLSGRKPLVRPAPAAPAPYRAET